MAGKNTYIYIYIEITKLYNTQHKDEELRWYISSISRDGYSLMRYKGKSGGGN